MVNLDMVGRIRDNKLMIGGYKTCAAFGEIIPEIDTTTPLSMTDMGDEFASRSDHANFIRREIPAIFFFSGLHEQYHSPADDAPLINYAGMEEAAETIYRVIEAIDKTPREKLKFTKAQEREMLEGGKSGNVAAEPV